MLATVATQSQRISRRMSGTPVAGSTGGGPVTAPGRAQAATRLSAARHRSFTATNLMSSRTTRGARAAPFLWNRGYGVVVHYAERAPSIDRVAAVSAFAAR